MLARDCDVPTWGLVSKSPKVHSADLVPVAIRPDVHAVAGGKLSAHDLNQDVLVKYWDGDIEYTEDAIAALKAIDQT